MSYLDSSVDTSTVGNTTTIAEPVVSIRGGGGRGAGGVNNSFSSLLTGSGLASTSGCNDDLQLDFFDISSSSNTKGRFRVIIIAIS